MPTICLNMIVGDEEHVIERCLLSVVDHIDSWVINCNGSDGSAEIVHRLLGHLPGKLLRDPWVNFAYTRSLVTRASQGLADYRFCIDSDEELRVNGRLADHITTGDLLSYWLYYSDSWAQTRPAILNDRLDWHYESVIHEYPTAAGVESRSTLDGVRVWHHKDGARWSDIRQKYENHAAVLEAELKGDVGKLRTRYQFYLGESYRDCGRKDDAIKAYRGRVALGGWPEEIYYSLYQIALLTGEVSDFLDAFEYRPSRGEALFALAERYREAGKHNTAYMLYSRIDPELPPDRLFVDRTIYDWRLWDGLSICGYYAGEDRQKLRRYAQLALVSAPDSQRSRIRKNLEYY